MQKVILVFDLDNTLIHRDQAMLDCIESLFDLHLSAAQKRRIFDLDERGHSDRLLFCGELKEFFNLNSNVETIWNLIKTNIGYFVRIEKEVRIVLEELRQSFDMIILTNGGIGNQKRKIAQTGLNIFFSEDKVFISESIGFDKPHPRIFQYVQERFTGDARFFMIGDHWEKDILGAVNFGWQAIYLNTGKDNRQHKNVIKISALTELIKLQDAFRTFGGYE